MAANLGKRKDKRTIVYDSISYIQKTTATLRPMALHWIPVRQHVTWVILSIFLITDVV